MRTPSFERESPEHEAHLISLAETVRRYMRALGAKQQIGAGIGKSDDPRARLGGFGEFGPGGAGWLGDTSRFLPPGGRNTGVTIDGRQVIAGGGDTEGSGSSIDNTGGYGGLGRGSLSGLGIPGAATHFGGGIGSFGGEGAAGAGDDEGGGTGWVGNSLGFLRGIGRGRLGSDPLLNARAWHRLHPADASGDEPSPPPPSGGIVVVPRSNGLTPIEKDPDADPYLIEAREAREKAKKEQLEDDMTVTGSMLSGATLGGAFFGLAGVVVGAVVGVGFGYLAMERQHRHREGGLGGGSVPADDSSGTGPGGPRMNGYLPADDGTGPSTPRSRAADVSRSTGDGRSSMIGFIGDYRPADDSYGPVGPRAITKAGSQTSPFDTLYKPNPDAPGPSTPHSRTRE